MLYLRILLLYCFFFIGCSLASASEYFVDVNGSDSNSGAKSAPWQSIERANKQKLSPGDALYFKGEQEFSGNIVVSVDDKRVKANGVKRAGVNKAGVNEAEVNQTGRSASDILISSYGTGRAKIKAGDGTGLLVRNSGHLIVRGLEFTADPKANTGFGVAAFNSTDERMHSIWLDDLVADGFRWSGFYVGGFPRIPGLIDKASGSGLYGYEGMKISRCIAKNNMYFGIWVSGNWQGRKLKGSSESDYANEDVSIINCIACDNPGNPNYKDNHSGNGILVEDTNVGLIDHCTAWHNGATNGSTSGGPVGIWADEANHIVIQFCEAYDNRTGGAADGAGFDLDGGVTNSVMQYNYSHGNDGAGYLVWSYWGALRQLKGNIIRYNISENDGRKNRYAGIHIGTSGGIVEQIDVYNNTVFMAKGTAATSSAAQPEGSIERKNAQSAQPLGVWIGGTEPCKRIRVLNNLIVVGEGVPLVEIEKGNEALFLNNAYWPASRYFKILDNGKTYSNIDEWRQFSKQEVLNGKPFGLVQDPKLGRVNTNQTLAAQTAMATLTSYQPAANSPIVNAGLDLAKEFNLDPGAQDYWGTPIPQGVGYEIGACEVAR